MGGLKDLFSLKKLGLTKKTQSVLGIDIGSSSIKIVQLRKEKERAILETYGELALGPYAKMEVGQSVKIPEESMITALKDVLKESNTTTKNAAMAISLRSSFVTIIDIPIIEGKSLTEIIELEARRYIPVPVSEVEMDWWVLPEPSESRGEEEDSDENKSIKNRFAKVLLVAIHKDVIGKHKTIISGAGIDVSTFEIESFSTIRSCVGPKVSPMAIIDFGASFVKMSIVDFGVMMGAHSVEKGSQDLSLSLSSSMSVDFNKAETMKREIGFSNLPEHREIVSVFEPTLEYIFSEMNKFIKDYQKKQKRVISRVVLTGGGALLKGIVGLAVKRLNLETEIADPFSKTEHPAFLGEVLKEAGPVFSVAIGLALRGLE